MVRVLVLPHKRVKGWRGDRAEFRTGVKAWPVIPLTQAVKASYRTDAHFCPYYVERNGKTPAKIPRLNKEGLEAVVNQGDRVLFGCVVIDVDDETAHQFNREHSAAIKAGDTEPMDARDDWRMAQDDLYGNFPPELLRGMGRYDTRGGYRLLWELEQPLGPMEYLAFVGALRVKLRSHGIQADDLKDWQRLYRLPFVERDGKTQAFDAELSGLGPIGWKPAVLNEDESVFSGIEQTNTLATACETITENRNNTLTALAGGFRRRGFEFPVILGMLDVINREQVQPPLDDGELETIARSVCRYDPAPQPTDGGGADTPAGGGGLGAGGFRFTLGDEVEIARVASDDMEKEDDLIHDRSKMWQYEPKMGIWRELEPHRIDRVIHSYSGEMVLRGLDRNGEPKVSPLRISSRLCEGVYKVMSSQKRKVQFFDDATDGLVFRNTFVRINADGVQTEDFDPGHRQTAYLPFDYSPGAFPTAFVTTLRQCWREDDDVEEKVELLREWIGAALCNRATDYQKGLVLHGSGANGKSMIQEIVMAMFPAGTVTSIPPQDMENEYRRAKLSSSRLNCVAELPEADILQSEAVKAMIGGDLVSARYIREAVFEYKPRAAMLFSANTLPGVRDMTAGFWRRWLVLTFDRQFKEEEMDRQLAGRIIAHDLPAIASWAIEGAAALAARGYFNVPKSSEQAVNAWRHQADQVACFVEQRCKTELEDGARGEGAAKLYNAYSQWAATNGHRRMSRVNFGKRLKLLGIAKSRNADGNVWDVELTEVVALVV
jgi:P4 family phage/plasmid primase-like protien